jgi:hypothetical protein
MADKKSPEKSELAEAEWAAVRRRFHMNDKETVEVNAEETVEVNAEETVEVNAEEKVEVNAEEAVEVNREETVQVNREETVKVDEAQSYMSPEVQKSPGEEEKNEAVEVNEAQSYMSPEVQKSPGEEEKNEAVEVNEAQSYLSREVQQSPGEEEKNEPSEAVNRQPPTPINDTATDGDEWARKRVRFDLVTSHLSPVNEATPTDDSDGDPVFYANPHSTLTIAAEEVVDRDEDLFQGSSDEANQDKDQEEGGKDLGAEKKTEGEETETGDLNPSEDEECFEDLEVEDSSDDEEQGTRNLHANSNTTDAKNDGKREVFFQFFSCSFSPVGDIYHVLMLIFPCS